MKVRKRIKEYKRYSNTPKAQAQIECGIYRESMRAKGYKVESSDKHDEAINADEYANRDIRSIIIRGI